MKFNPKRKAMIALVALTGVICIFALAGLLTKKHHHDDRNLCLAENQPVIAHGVSDTAPAFTGNDAGVANRGHPDISDSVKASRPLLEKTICINENTDTPDADVAPITHAARKEQFIRERFGVIRRHGKWIPTTGGGTNLVYITTGSLPPGRVGEVYDVQFNAASGCPPYQWNIIGTAWPESLSLDRHSGRLCGTPPEPITASFFLLVTDSQGAKDMAEYSLVIQPEAALAIVTTILPGAFPGQDYCFQLQASGGMPPYAWCAGGDLTEIGILFLDPQTGQLSGQIAETAPRIDVPLVVRVSDSQGSVSREFDFHIRPGLSILALPTSPIRVSEEFEFAFQATGGLEPCAWGIEGNIPPGLEFSETGILKGQPAEAGLYNLRVGVYDADGQSDNLSFELEVLPVLEAAVSDFQALLSRNRVALSWAFPVISGDLSVRIVRNSATAPLTPADGQTLYQGADTVYLDENAGAGRHYYAAFLEANNIAATAMPPPIISIVLPPASDPFADKVAQTRLLHPNAFRAVELPRIVIGAPRGTGMAWGSTDVVSLGAAVNEDSGATAPYGGEIILEFTDNDVWNGPGADFTIFENVFYVCDSAGVPDPTTRFMEPAVVAVSQDGITWRQFPIDFSPRYDPDSGSLNLRHPYCYHRGFAGVNPVMSNGNDPDPTDPEASGGDSFDLEELGLDWIRYVRIQSTGSRWLWDNDGDLVYHNETSGAATRSSDKSGFDLDAVTAIWMMKVPAD